MFKMGALRTHGSQVYCPELFSLLHRFHGAATRLLYPE